MKFSNRHVAHCFLHYLVILLIRLSDQNVWFRMQILRKITVTQFFLKDRSEEKVLNFALDSVCAGGILSFSVGILIFMLNIWCVNSIFVYNLHHAILNLHMLGVLKRTIESSDGDHDTWHDHDCIAGWKLLSFRYFWQALCHFACFLVFIQF